MFGTFNLYSVTSVGQQMVKRLLYCGATKMARCNQPTLTWPPHMLSWAEAGFQTEAIVDNWWTVKKNEKSAVIGCVKTEQSKK